MSEALTFIELKERLQHNIDEMIAHDINHIVEICKSFGNEELDVVMDNISYYTCQLAYKSNKEFMEIDGPLGVVCESAFGVTGVRLERPSDWYKEYPEMVKDAYLQTIRSKTKRG